MSEQTSTPRLTDQFAKAMVYAEQKHHTQVRKGGDIPYVGHLLSVAGLVINDNGSEAQAIGALLHDAVEDAGGAETLREIKADPSLRQIPVVVLTTSKAEEDIYRTYDLGANSFITKPVMFESLVRVMRDLGTYWFEIVELPRRS